MTRAASDLSAHPAHLQHHFESLEQQSESGKLGMWIFLATEILLFGGLFCAYAVYRAGHPEVFVYAHRYLDKVLGGVNTVVLLTSSLTMAWAVRCAQLGKSRGMSALLALTLLGGCAFMGIKFVEYEAKWKHGLLWGKRFQPAVHGEEPSGREPDPPAAGRGQQRPARPTGAPSAPAAERSSVPPSSRGPRGTVPAEVARQRAAYTSHGEPPRNVQIFFGIYFLMTGLHALHVLAGMGAIGWVLLRGLRGAFSPLYYLPVDLVGLYWHLVDLIWIFLFPLLYLIH